MARTRKKVMVLQAWHTTQAQEIYRGISEYSKLKPEWDIDVGAHVLLNYEPLQKWDIDGLIAPLELSHQKQIRKAPFAVVSTRGLPTEDFAQICVDHEQTGRLAAETFCQQGYRSFAVYFLPTAQADIARKEAFRKALLEKFQTLEIPCVEKPFHFDDEAPQEWVLELARPTAVFCTNDWAARKLIRFCQTKGVAVPDSVAVLGCENELIQCEGIHPTISSIELPYRRIGHEAARMLDRLMEKRPPAERCLRLPPVGVADRMSTGAEATSDRSVRKAMQYIRQHVTEPVSLGLVARQAGVSLRVLQRRFQLEYSCSPGDMIRRVKTEHIRMLLRTTDLTIAEIGRHMGFSSESYFSTFFKKSTGTSPGQYRKTHRLR